MATTYPDFHRRLARSHSALHRSLLVCAFAAFGCHANVRGDRSGQARVRHDAEETPDLDKPIVAEGLRTTSRAPAASSSPAAFETALLGARQDFSLVLEHANAACACVKIAIGGAHSAAFQWQSAPARLSDDKQLAFAMSSESMTCKGEPKGSSGASYWGYRISGNDVIVFVEGARAGRPRTSAAIIPKPVGEGQVYVAPATKLMPYGRPLEGTGARCKVGSVPERRATPFTQAELGDSVTNDAGSDLAPGAVE